MDRASFNKSMERVMSFYKLPVTAEEKAQFNGYMDATYEAVSRMDAYLFDTTTKELTKSLSRGQKPVPGQMYAIYERLRDKQPKKEFVCDSCKATGWAYAHMVNAETGQEGDFALPCPKCRPSHPLKDAPPRAGWTFQDTPAKGHEVQLLEMARKMGPQGARLVLDLAVKMKVNFTEAVLDELVKRSADAPAQENKTVESVLEKLSRAPGREAAAEVAVGSPAPSEAYEIEE